MIAYTLTRFTNRKWYKIFLKYYKYCPARTSATELEDTMLSCWKRFDYYLHSRRARSEDRWLCTKTTLPSLKKKKGSIIGNLTCLYVCEYTFPTPSLKLVVKRRRLSVFTSSFVIYVFFFANVTSTFHWPERNSMLFTHNKGLELLDLCAKIFYSVAKNEFCLYWNRNLRKINCASQF